MITDDPMGEFAALCAIACIGITGVFAVLNIVFIVISLIKKMSYMLNEFITNATEAIGFGIIILVMAISVLFLLTKD